MLATRTVRLAVAMAVPVRELAQALQLVEAEVLALDRPQQELEVLLELVLRVRALQVRPVPAPALLPVELVQLLHKRGLGRLALAVQLVQEAVAPFLALVLPELELQELLVRGCSQQVLARQQVSA